MKITKRQLRKIILQEKQDLPARFLNWVFDDDMRDDDRHPRLDAIVDAVNAAKREMDFQTLKNFLFGLNHKFANRELIEVTGSDLRGLIREYLDTHNMDHNRAYELIAVLQEFGYSLFLPPATDSNNIAIDDALAAYPGEFTYDELMTAVRIVQGRGA